MAQISLMSVTAMQAVYPAAESQTSWETFPV